MNTIRYFNMTKYLIIVLKRIRAYNNMQVHIECLPNYSVYIQQTIYMKGTVYSRLFCILCSKQVNMEKGDIFNVVFLCIINIIFMVAGIFLNSVVIISLWRSRQLRKKLCYFTILVLSCFDLAVVIITHPLLIASTIYFSFQEVNEIYETAKGSISLILHGFSMFALFTLNIERFLALTRPFFHQASVTKTRIVRFQGFLMIVFVIGLSPALYSKTKTIVYIVLLVNVFSLLFLCMYSNYKMYVIAKSKREDQTVGPTTATSVDENRKELISNLKNICTCSWAVGCFFFCSCPGIIYSILRLASETPFHDRQVLLFYTWTGTFLSMNSTFNCLIFFWRNSSLRREGIKIVTFFRQNVN